MLTRSGGCAILFFFGTPIVPRHRRMLFSAGQRVGHVVGHGRPEVHRHGMRLLLHEGMLVGRRRPLGQPPRPLPAPPMPAAAMPLLRLCPGVRDVDVAVKVAEVGRGERRLMRLVMVVVVMVVRAWRVDRWRMRGRHLRGLERYKENFGLA